jgi:hypothetical protein
MVLFSCNQSKEKPGWTVNGTIEGLSEGVILHKKKEYKVTNGTFQVTGPEVKEPTRLGFSIKGAEVSFSMYVENGITNYSAKLVEKERNSFFENKPEKYKQLIDEKIEGSIVNEHHKEYFAAINSSMQAYHKKMYQAKRNKQPADEINKLLQEKEQKKTEAELDFIKKHTKDYYGAVALAYMCKGKNKDEVEKALKLLDPSMDNSIVRSLKEQVAKSKDVDISEAITVRDVSYKVEKTFDGSSVLNVVYMGVFSNDHICTLTNDGTIKLVNTYGKPINSFKPKSEFKPTSLAIDEKDNIYVLCPLVEEVTKEYRGKTYKKKQTTGYLCKVFNQKGNRIRTMELSSLHSATGARVANNKLMIADRENRIIAVYNSETGEKEAVLEGMRPCCGILDFSINEKNEILVANLGAFRVQAYDMRGKQLLAFGQRGKDVSDFHGCCNPVSVAFLSNGAIVTVEKDPTRIKVYSQEGAKQIEGIQELVSGCTYIPMIVDGNDNLYLASPKKGIIKCIPQKKVV